jgi:hypothetical protein
MILNAHSRLPLKIFIAFIGVKMKSRKTVKKENLNSQDNKTCYARGPVLGHGIPSPVAYEQTVNKRLFAGYFASELCMG